MNYFRSEMKVGILVFCAIFLLVTLMLGIGGFQLFHPTKDLYVYFSFVNGLEQDAPVRYAGVKIGKVNEIKILKESDSLPDPIKRVRIKIKILDNVDIDRTTKAAVNTLGLMGEKYIELTSGITKEMLKDGDYILGEDLFTMQELMDVGKNIVATLEHTIVSIDSIVGNKENKQAIGSAIVGVEQVVHNLESFTQHLNNIVEKNEDVINTVLIRADYVIQKLEKLLQSTDDVIVNNKDDIRKMIKDLKETMEYAKSFAQKIDRNPSSLIWKSKEEKIREQEEQREKVVQEKAAKRKRARG